MPLDMVKDGDTDIQDLLRGDAALLDAAKKGCLARVQKLCSPENINCRDTQGRNSTPLHLAGNLYNTHTPDVPFGELLSFLFLKSFVLFLGLCLSSLSVCQLIDDI